MRTGILGRPFIGVGRKEEIRHREVVEAHHRFS